MIRKLHFSSALGMPCTDQCSRDIVKLNVEGFSNADEKHLASICKFPNQRLF
jgi:hypothetical protein